MNPERRAMTKSVLEIHLTIKQTLPKVAAPAGVKVIFLQKSK